MHRRAPNRNSFPTDDLGFALRLGRVRSRLTQEAVARDLGVSASLISLIENNWRVPSPEQLARFCSLVGVSPSELKRNGTRG